MDKTFVETLDIRNVYQTQVSKNRIRINFSVNETTFQMFLTLHPKKNGFYPYAILHKGKENEACNLCKKKLNVGSALSTTCSSIENYYTEMFYRLIEHPSIRLEWLYIPHALEA